MKVKMTKAKIYKYLIPFIIFSTLVYALTEEEMEIAANLEFFQEYEMIEREDFQEVIVDSKAADQKEDIKVDLGIGEEP
jgi:hypothetical protein